MNMNHRAFRFRIVSVEDFESDLISLTNPAGIVKLDDMVKLDDEFISR
jgi:hypothetical protein